jgi:hypothetical protein
MSFDRALTASENIAEFTALFSEHGLDANMVNPHTGRPLIEHLIMNLRDERLPSLLAVLLQHHVFLGVEAIRKFQDISIPLGYAALEGKIRAYSFLLKHTDPALFNRPMHTPVLLAAARSQRNIKNTLQVLKDLIEVRGADIDIRDSAGNTALSLASEFMQPEIVEFLLKKKANVWLGRRLPIVMTFQQLHSQLDRMVNVQTEEDIARALDKHKRCLEAIMQATYEYFYNFAVNYADSLQALEQEFLSWRDYIEFQIDEIQYAGLRNRMRKHLDIKIFHPILKRLAHEKSQRLPVCMGLHRLAFGLTEKNKIPIPNPLYDKDMVGEVLSYVAAKPPRHLSLPTKWQSCMHDTLLKINMVRKTTRDGIWYALDYRLYCENLMNSYDEKYAQGYANAQFWEMTAPFVFRIKEGVLPAAALEAFLKGLTIADCGSVLVACQYAALLKTIGAEKFNVMFSADAAPLTITQSIFDPINPLAYFFTRAGGKVNPGDMCYFSGLEYFSKKHPLGHARGWSVVCTGKNAIGENMYYGFGQEDFKICSMNERMLGQTMVAIYNLPPNKYNQDWIAAQSSREEYDLRQQCIPVQVSYTEAMPALGGYQPDSTISPDYNKIADYVLKEAVTAAGFIADYDIFLGEHNYPAFNSRPSSMLLELPGIADGLEEESKTPPDSPRVGIPMLRY